MKNRFGTLRLCLDWQSLKSIEAYKVPDAPTFTPLLPRVFLYLSHVFSARLPHLFKFFVWIQDYIPLEILGLLLKFAGALPDVNSWLHASAHTMIP